MIFFWILWAFCAGIFCTLLYFFFNSLKTTPGGPPKLFFRAAFLVFSFLTIALLGSLWLVFNDYKTLAKLLLSIPDFVGFLFLLWLLRAATWKGRWN